MAASVVVPVPSPRLHSQRSRRSRRSERSRRSRRYQRSRCLGALSAVSALRCSERSRCAQRCQCSGVLGALSALWAPSAAIALRVLDGLGDAAVGAAGSALGSPLVLQRRDQPRDLRRQRVEHDGRLGQRALHGAGQLAQQHLARLQVGELGDLGRLERATVEQPALDHQQRVRLGEVAQRLRGVDRLAGDERDRGRSDEHVVEPGDPGVRGSPLDQGVLCDGVGGVLAKRPAQLGELRHGQTAVLGDHRGARGAEPVRDLGDRCDLVGLRHASPPS